MKVLVLGEGGQLSSELIETQPEGVELHQWGRSRWDFEKPDAIDDLLADLRPDAVINAVAYTAVDRAEEEETKAEVINAVAVDALAKACSSYGSRLLHVSTDFVFDGKGESPYKPNHPTSPLGVYGRTKRSGEEKILNRLPNNALIIRTSWVYSAHGQNFVKTMLRLMKEKEFLKVVSDQRGCPTWARGLAQSLWQMCLSSKRCGIYHWSDRGVISWYDFAVAIQEEGFSLGLLNKRIPVHAISSEQYPTPASRPAFSALDSSQAVADFGLNQRPWRESLKEMLSVLKNQD